MAYIKLETHIRKLFGAIPQNKFKGSKTQYVRVIDVAQAMNVDPVILLANFYKHCPTFNKMHNFVTIIQEGVNFRKFCFSYIRINRSRKGYLDEFDDAVLTGDYGIRIPDIENIWIRSSLAVKMTPKKVYKLKEEIARKQNEKQNELQKVA